MDLRTAVELKVLEIQNHNERTVELCSTLMNVYQKDKNSKPFQSENDLYQEEQKFIYQAFKQTEVERQLGQEMIKYLEFVEQLEKKKLVLIK